MAFHYVIASKMGAVASAMFRRPQGVGAISVQRVTGASRDEPGLDDLYEAGIYTYNVWFRLGVVMVALAIGSGFLAFTPIPTMIMGAFFWSGLAIACVSLMQAAVTRYRLSRLIRYSSSSRQISSAGLPTSRDFLVGMAAGIGVIVFVFLAKH